MAVCKTDRALYLASAEMQANRGVVLAAVASPCIARRRNCRRTGRWFWRRWRRTATPLKVYS